MSSYPLPDISTVLLAAIICQLNLWLIIPAGVSPETYVVQVQECMLQMHKLRALCQQT